MSISLQKLDAGCVRAIGESSQGVRPDNEDAMLLRPDLGLYAVCDGMGGHGHGDVAAAHAIEGVAREIAATRSEPAEARVRKALLAAAAAVRRAGQAVSPDDPIGTTLTMVLIVGKQLVCGHVGDSRLFRLRDGKLEQLTTDHNLAQELRKYGTVSPRTLRAYEGVLTRYLGSDKHSDGDIITCELRDGDRLLICSDGLNVVPAGVVQTSLAEKLDDVPGLLLEKAQFFSSLDNVTVLALAIEGDRAEQD
jgi:serine/threonine protein phosphatase PrpC